MQKSGIISLSLSSTLVLGSHNGFTRGYGAKEGGGRGERRRRRVEGEEGGDADERAGGGEQHPFMALAASSHLSRPPRH